MKVTLDLPDALFRRAKASAAMAGCPVKDLVRDAIRDKLRSMEANAEEKSWRVAFGTVRRADTDEIDAIIEAEFSTVDPEAWR